MRRLTGAEQYLAETWPPFAALPRDEAYRLMGQFLDDVEALQQAGPPPSGPVAGIDPVSIGVGLLVSAALSVGSAAVSSLLAPRRETNIPQPQQPGQIVTQNIGGQLSGILSQTFSGSSSFQSIQQVLTFENFYPCIWALREQFAEQADPYRPAGFYGGLTATLGLVWSRVQALTTASIAQLIWVVGEGPINGIEPSTLALGNAPIITNLGQVDADWSQGAPMTLYARSNGGRIVSADQVFGSAAANDVGNAENAGGPDVFSVRSISNALRPDHSYATTPGNATFGLYGPMPCHGMVRKTPTLEVMLTMFLRPIGAGFDPPTADQLADPEDSPATLAEIYGRHMHWSLRCGVIDVNGAQVGTTQTVAVVPGDVFRYRLDSTTDGGDETVQGTRIVYDMSNTDIDDNELKAEVQQSDIAGVVAGRQKQIAAARSLGEVVKFGSAVATLIGINPADQPFRSDLDSSPVGNGVTVTYTYRVLRGGIIGVSVPTYFNPTWSGTDIKPTQWNRNSPYQNTGIPATYLTASTFPQGSQMATATIAIDRECLVFEINYTSNCWLVIGQGFPSLRGSPDLEEIAWIGGQRYSNDLIAPDTTTNTSNFRSNSLPTIYETRISLFRIWIRRQGETDNDWVVLPTTFGIRGNAQQARNNTLRFYKPWLDKPLVYHEPIGSWELNSNTNAPDPIIILDGGTGTAQSTVVGDLTVYWTGVTVTRARSNFRLSAVEPTQNVGYSWSVDAGADSTMFDLSTSEWHPYGEAQISSASGPENTVASVNIITVYDKLFEYSDLAILGANILSNPSLNSISQASITCVGGTETRRYLELDSVGPTHQMPDIARARLTSKRYGLGDRISDVNIDNNSFRDAAIYCELRRYFYDLQQENVPDVISWMDEAADHCLLDYAEINGRHVLRPALRFDPIVDAASGLVAMFSGSTDERESLKIKSLDIESILPVQISVIYSELRADDSPLNPALFSRERQVTVRRSSTPSSAPIITFRLPACTNRYHAIDYGMWKIRQREVQRRTASLVTFPSVVGVDLMLNYARIYSDFFGQTAGCTGRVNDDGTINATRPDLLETGSYSVFLWDLDTGAEPGTLIVDAAGLGSPTGVMFALNDQAPFQTFQARGIKLRPDSMVEVDLIEYPLEPDGTPTLTAIWSNTYQSDAFWTFVDG